MARFRFIGWFRKDGAHGAEVSVEGAENAPTLEDAIRTFENKIGRTFSAWKELPQ